MSTAHHCNSEASANLPQFTLQSPTGQLRGPLLLLPGVCPSCHLRVQEIAPSLVSLSQNPPSPPFSVWCGRAPSLVSHSQRPQVWYRKARAPPTLWFPTGSTSLSPWRGVVLSPVWYHKARAPSLVSQSQNPPHPLVCCWVSLSFSVVWCGLMSFSEHTATTYKDRCSGLAASMRRRLEGQGVQR